MDRKELSLKEIQEESFKVLLKIKEIFDENGWKYYLIAGTLIGAVRHKGFIPWDDDIDLWIPRPDYEKFVEYCIKNKEKLYPFELIHYKTNDKYIYPIARFSDSRYILDYKNTKDYGLGLFVDLYPLDGVKENYYFFKKKMHNINRKIVLCGAKKMVKGNSKIKNFLKIPYYFIIKKSNLNKLLEKCDKIAQKYKFEEYSRVECVCWADHFFTYEKKWIIGDEEKFLEFNGELFRVPSDYDKVLTRLYGNYMKLPPKEEQIAHHFYKAYKK
ncbi:MAG: LicD family protein [Clostridia bacterium]|nr:LicD family protein [Clostridia bacterium]